MTALAITLGAGLVAVAIAAFVLVGQQTAYARDALSAESDAKDARRDAEAVRDLAVRARDSALADAVAEKKRAEQAVAGEAAQRERADKAEAIVRTHVEKQLDSDDPAAVAAAVAELLATDLRNPADAARPAADRGGSAGAAAVRSAAGAGSGGGG
jgi:hypothetical protein